MLVVVFLALFLFYAGLKYWKSAEKDFDNFGSQIKAAKEQIVQQLDLKQQAKSKLDELNTRKPWPLDPSMFFWSNEYAAWRKAYYKADELANAARETEQNAILSLNDAKEGKWWGVALARKCWAIIMPLAGYAAFAVFVLPSLWKIFWFYLIAPLASRAPAIKLKHSIAGEDVLISSPSFVQEVEISPKETVYTRADWVNEYPADGVKKDTRMVWDWASPLISCAAGLRELTEWKVTGNRSEILKLCAGSDPNLKIVKVVLDRHSGLVIKPSRIIAISGDIQLSTEWRLLNLHSWISGRLRHIIFFGSGTLYLSGYGDIRAESRENRRRMADKLLIAYDTRVPFRTVRTETFWPFLRGTASLYDLQFEEPGLVIYQASAPSVEDAGGKPMTSRIEGWFDLLLKPLGF